MKTLKYQALKQFYQFLIYMYYIYKRIRKESKKLII